MTALPLAAVPATNPLEGHVITMDVPELDLTVDGSELLGGWSGPVVINVDGRPAARAILPAVRATLPRRRWTARDYLIAAGCALGAGGAGYAAGRIVQALR